MRIALVTTSFLPHVGGAEFAIHYLAQEWSAQGHVVCVFNTVTDRVSEAGAAYTLRRYPLLRGTTRFGWHRFPFARFAARQIGRMLRSWKPDFISAHFGYPVGIWLAGLRPRPRYLITCHGPALNETPQGPRQRYGIDRLIAGSLNRSARAVAISSHARSVMERIGVDPDKIVDIPNGVDLRRFDERVRGFDLRRTFNLPQESLIVLSVGRESWAKAYDVGLEAFARVAGQVADVYYVILGKGTGKWRDLAAELGVGDRVVLCEGLQSDELVGAYQQADVFFLPSVKELCPLVVPEAMAAGLPEVVTNVSGSQDMVRDGYNGFVVEPRDCERMAEAVLRLVRDRNLREEFGAASLGESERYGWDRISRAYLRHRGPAGLASM